MKKQKRKIVKMSGAQADRLLNAKKSQDLKCKCGTVVPHTSTDAVSVTCSKCTSALVPFELPSKKAKVEKKVGYPRGWKLMQQFVYKDGTVYRFGVESPKLKGTLPVTDVDAIKETQRKNREANKIKKEARLLKRYNKAKKEKKISKKKAKAKLNVTE